MSDETNVKNMTEQQLRDYDPKWPKSMKELSAFIDALAERQHDYGTCVYAMSLAAVSAFHYVAWKLGVTGFQASCADLDVLKRTRHLEGPFMILDASKMLYPQYDLRGDVDEFLSKDTTAAWLKEQAIKKLDDSANSHAVPNVVAHWKRLAGR